MSTVLMKARLGNLRLYKLDVPNESDVGVILVTYGGDSMTGGRFQLTGYTGRGQGRGSKAGLSKSFVEMVKEYFPHRVHSKLTNQIFDYIVSNFSFKDLEIVPPACSVLVFHFHTRELNQDHFSELGITPFIRAVLDILGTKESVLCVEDAITRRVPIAPPTTEILDSYQISELCCLCDEGYPKENEIVHKTRCNHIFHATCITRYLLHTPQCPVCSVHLPPIDVRTLLFS